MRFQRRFALGRQVQVTVFAVLISIGSVAPGNAQGPAVTVFAAARTAAQKQQLRKSEQVGFSIMKTAYSDIPAEGGVLLGFDLQLSKFLDHEIVHALKPIYATETGSITTKEFGVFGVKIGKQNAELTRNVRISAPQGFAVGSISVRRGLYIDALRLNFHRLKGSSLDKNNAIISDWIGNNKAGHAERMLGGNGAPIVGIFGNMDERRVLALGVYQLPTIAAALPRPEPKLHNDRPAIPERKPELENVAVLPEKKPVEEAAVEPAEAIGNHAVAKAEPKAASKPQSQASLPWLPIGIFVCVSGLLFLSCWLVFGNKQADQIQGKHGSKQTARITPPPLPKDTDEADEPRLKKLQTPAALSAEMAKATVPNRVDSTAVMAKTPYATTISSGAFREGPAGAEAVGSEAFERGSTDDSLADLPSIARTQPPYFQGRAVYALKPNQFYRVYVLPKMLLFLDAGPETNDQFARGVGAAGAVAGGILGAVVGHAIGSVIDSTREDARYARKKLLNTANADELVQMSAEEGASFGIAPADLRRARIEPPSTWHTMQYLGNQYVGLLSFCHPDQGDMTLEIPTPDDMRIALAELPAVFEGDLRVNVELDRRSWQYVPKSS